MRRDVLDAAQSMMNRRHFNKAIIMLESRRDFYEGVFDYYLILAIACLYAGDTGAAFSYFQRARKIKLTNTTLLIGQAAIFLKRGDTARAIQYYMEVLDNDPANKIALSALDFIRESGDYSTICRWVDTGKIEQFYPPLGVNPLKIAGIVLPVAACILGVFAVFIFSAHIHPPVTGSRADLRSLILSVDERKNAEEKDSAAGTYKFNLSAHQISSSYEKAMSYFQSYRDNAAQVEINRILNSNASNLVKKNARTLMGYIEEPSFDSVKDAPSYQDVQTAPELYMDCWVVWAGRISDAVQESASYSCNLLVGYETMQKIEGIVPLKFAVSPVIESSKPLRVLAKISSDGGKLCLIGRAVHQDVNDILEKPE
ncbi:MAG: tetratricopeptide repeat protein [Treponema sp.]